MGEGTAAELAEYPYDSYPADGAFWQVKPGDPGADNQFDAAVYDRGALALQALRKAVGDDSFFKILQTWQAQKSGTHATIQEFIALAEKVSGKPLYDLFQTWLFTPGKPARPGRKGVGGFGGVARAADGRCRAEVVDKIQWPRRTPAPTPRNARLLTATTTPAA